MICSYLFFFSLFLFNINFVSSTVYSCNHNAECGCSKNDVVIDKIVGGESAASSSWGWAVSLQRDGSHFCGGSIISPLHIITAAHCVPNPTTVIGIVNVVASIDKLSESSSSKAQVRFITNVFSHPNYNDTSKVNDIAVLRLDEPLYISYDVGTARLCIPRTVSTNIRDDYPIPGSSLVAIGWGTLASGDISIPDNLHLQQVTLNAMSSNHEMCIPTINNQQVQFCAAVIGGGKDTCQGDSGGPLMHFDNCNAECGSSKTDVIVDKIVGGESTVDSSWGWAVSLQIYGSHICDGAIILPLYIVTAAHCVICPSEMIRNTKVVVGIDKLNQSSTSTAQVRSIVRAFAHPNYNSVSNANDIAVLRFYQPLDISYDRGTARLCIPRVVSTNIRDDYPVPNSALVAIG
ncbi:unnamed protein product [Rotaria sp. Silwood1]|nr:unnamed protein product [Rotaria sp. Silwood1]